MSQLQQHQVPDGMVANVPWGQPFERWSDRMLERGLKYLDGSLDKTPNGEGEDIFPNIYNAMGAVAAGRGLTL